MFQQGTNPVCLGVYNHEDDVCYVREEVSKGWDRHPNKFHATIAAHELGHRYVRKKRETLNIAGVGAPFWEEKYCGWVEGGFGTYVFGKGNTDKYVEWRRNMQTELGGHIFDRDLDNRATAMWIAKYREQ